MSTATTQQPAAAPQLASPGPPVRALIALARVLVGWVLFWAGLDKILGLGFPTEDGSAVIDGVSATEGYLTHGLDPDSLAADVLGPLSGNPVADVLYLAGTFGAGLALILGVCVRLAGAGGAVLFLSLWFSSFPLEYNPVVDEHLFYAAALALLVALDAGRYYGLASWWRGLPIVRNAPLLG
ncbi:DoxX family membrane protein [Streptomyces sp. NBRC 109706]|uniref:DoxX family membrane protein n=1 Tax=Streptomyces sp. NBRC 109706 TaxID=1550035 RepID=UPI000785AA62|nr:DoxX family membrane protein [Streptomyces sp. NBRC 109706]